MMSKVFFIVSAAFVAVLTFFYLGIRSQAQAVETGDSLFVPASYTFRLADVTWDTVVNNSVTMPNSTRNFSSYGQPSVSKKGTVVFRARSTGGHPRQTGIYVQGLRSDGIIAMADITTYVPPPNNLGTMFQEFPSIPRISMKNDFTATRGNHQPVWRYFLPDDTETRAGTTGIYAKLGLEVTRSGVSKLGMAPGYDFFEVPGYSDLAFDVFPGSPAITDDGSVVFKGNYTVDEVGKTGVFFRRLLDTDMGGSLPIIMIASSDTYIPNLPDGVPPTKFGSTAPPSAVEDEAVFVGLDNEDDPSYGGIYLAPLVPAPVLQPLVTIGEPVPGMSMPPLTRVGEALSFDGRYLAFWGAWGTETKTIRLYCLDDGNAQRRAYCIKTSTLDPETDRYYQEFQIPVNQGIFLLDIKKEQGYLVAKTGTDGDFDDFLFWVYSGHVPGTDGGEDSEPPRWRYSAFAAASDTGVAFKARTGDLGTNGEYIDPVDGVYFNAPQKNREIVTLVETGMDGAIIDPMITSEFPGELLPVTGVGIEREGFRGNYLSITVSMANEESDWAGIYLTRFLKP